LNRSVRHPNIEGNRKQQIRGKFLKQHRASPRTLRTVNVTSGVLSCWKFISRIVYAQTDILVSPNKIPRDRPTNKNQESKRENKALLLDLYLFLYRVAIQSHSE
jgi:hypothetical protein